jgi:outer membrane protein with beta-barrel domain
MMKRALVGLAAAAIAFVPAVSQAQQHRSASEPMKFSAGLGVALPQSDFADGVGTGLHIEGMASKRLAASPAFLRGELGYAHFGEKDNSGTTSNQIAAALDLGYNFAASSSVKPYILGGLGAYRTALSMDLGAGNATVNDNKTNLGYNAGVGMRFKMGGHVAYIEGRYVDQGNWDGAKIASLPIAFGLEF